MYNGSPEVLIRVSKGAVIGSLEVLVYHPQRCHNGVSRGADIGSRGVIMGVTRCPDIGSPGVPYWGQRGAKRGSSGCIMVFPEVL